MSIMIQFELNVRQGLETEITAFFKSILPGTIAFSGNEGARLATMPGYTDRLILIEYWDSQESFEAYIAWRKEIGDFDRLGTMLYQEPHIEQFKVLA